VVPRINLSYTDSNFSVKPSPACHEKLFARCSFISHNLLTGYRGDACCLATYTVLLSVTALHSNDSVPQWILTPYLHFLAKSELLSLETWSLYPAHPGLWGGHQASFALQLSARRWQQRAPKRVSAGMCRLYCFWLVLRSPPWSVTTRNAQAVGTIREAEVIEY
jgi:hypothetical protein